MGNNNDFDDLFRQGTQLLKRGKTAASIEKLEQAHALDPDHVDVNINLSGAYILTKKFKKAVPILETLSEAHPDHVMIWTNLGAAYLGNPILAREDEQLRAIEAFKRAIALNPAAPHVAYNIGLIYRDRKETTEAAHWFEKALQANPHDKDARRLLQKINNPVD